MSAAFAVPQNHLAVQINVTPLVDVMLVLLVIFLLSVPIATQRLPLTDAACASHCDRAGEPVRLAVKADGEMYWNGVAVTRAGLALNIAALVQRPVPAIEVHPQRGVHYQSIVDVLAAAHAGGVQRIGIAATED